MSRMTAVSTIERVMQLARTGTVRSIDDIRRTLHREQCDSVEQHLSSGALKKQLQAQIAARIADSSS